ncbi:Ca(2+)-dependent cysteine protease [Rhizophlyctis rosea]|nr:Ca(2+)-dependent cysteine protease [Rhizophlyctis rosea]
MFGKLTKLAEKEVQKMMGDGKSNQQQQGGYPGQYSQSANGYPGQYQPPPQAPYGQPPYAAPYRPPPGPPPQGYGAYAPPQGPPPPQSYGGYAPPQGNPPQNAWTPPQPLGPPYAPAPQPYQYQQQGYHGVPPPQQPHPQQQPYHPPPGAPPAQQWGTFTAGGKRKALFIGINYFGQQSELRGCINDVWNVHRWLTKNYPYAPQEILVLTDDQKDPTRIPTRQNITNAMRWLVAGAAPGDAFFLHFSGHGSQQRDADGDEEDGTDETIVPVDYKTAGQITDDEMNAILVRPLPQGSRLTAIFDCCHSGSMMDLPYTYSITGQQEIVVRDNAKELLQSGMKIGMALLTKNKLGALMEAKNLAQNLMQGGAGGSEKARRKTEMMKGSQALVVQFSGCRDDQTSADASIGGNATGAMSWALLTALEQNNYHMTYTQVLRDTRNLLQGKYKQIPQMSTGFQFDVHNTQFSVI